MGNLLTAIDTAQLLAVPNHVVDQLVADHRIPCVTLPLVDSPRFDVTDLAEWVERFKRPEQCSGDGGQQ